MAANVKAELRDSRSVNLKPLVCAGLARLLKGDDMERR